MKNQKRIFLASWLCLFGLGLVMIWPWFGSEPVWGPQSVAASLVARAHFLAGGGRWSGWFDNWYLGTPYRFLGSPLLPLILAGLNTTFGLGFWAGYRLLGGLGVVFLPLVVGWVGLISGKKETRVEGGVLAGWLNLIVPSLLFVLPASGFLMKEFGAWSWPAIMVAWLGNGARVIGLDLVLTSLGFVFGWLQGQKKNFWPALVLAALGILAELGVVVTWLVGLSLLVVSFWVAGKKPKKTWRRARVLLIGVLGLLSFVYTPRFWWIALSAPSLAGKRVFSVGLFATRFLSVIVPLLLGLLVVKSRKKTSSGWVWACLWLIVFGLLTLGRWLADIDFWQDYTAWGAELGVGVSLVIGLGVARLEKIRWSQLGLLVVVLLTGLSWLTRWPSLWQFKDHGFRDFVLSRRQALGERLGKNERTFVSGGLVFWLDEDSDLVQVRGGLDQAAVHPFWHHAAYQVRAGESGELAYQWLRALGVGWVLIHGSESADPYHDFVYPEKFSSGEWFGLVWEDGGDRLYQVKRSGLAREVVDIERMRKLNPPANGNDAVFLAKYDSLVNSLLPLGWGNQNEFIVTVPERIEGVSVAVSFDPGWRASLNGQPLKVYRDSLGQLLVQPPESGEISFKYRFPWVDLGFGMGLSLLTVVWCLVQNRRD